MPARGARRLLHGSERPDLQGGRLSWRPALFAALPGQDLCRQIRRQFHGRADPGRAGKASRATWFFSPQRAFGPLSSMAAEKRLRARWRRPDSMRPLSRACASPTPRRRRLSSGFCRGEINPEITAALSRLGGHAKGFSGTDIFPPQTLDGRRGGREARRRIPGRGCRRQHRAAAGVPPRRGDPGVQPDGAAGWTDTSTIATRTRPRRKRRSRCGRAG